MTTARKQFIEQVTMPSATPLSEGALMQLYGWGFELDANNQITTTPSLDSFTGEQSFISPLSETLYIGHDQYVRDHDYTLAGVRYYKGYPAEAGDTFNIGTFTRGIIDPQAVWFYSVNAQQCNLMFKGI
jgi:hypothetical protein